MKVAYYLLSLLLIKYSYMFVKVNYCRPNSMARAIVQADGKMQEQKPLHEKYY